MSSGHPIRSLNSAPSIIHVKILDFVMSLVFTVSCMVASIFPTLNYKAKLQRFSSKI